MDAKTPAADREAPLDRGRVAALAAMIAAAGAFGAGLSLGLPLLSLVLESRGVSGSWIGLNTAIAGLSAFVVAPMTTPLARRFGTARVLILSLVVVAVSFLGFYAAPAFWMWFPLRLVFHGGLGLVFMLSEFWINSLAPPSRRGFVLGIYASVLSAGFSVGPLVLSLIGSHGFTPFAVGSAVLLLSILPILLALGQTPALEERGHRSVFGLALTVPVATMAAFSFGAVESGGLAILPIYGLRVGFTENEAALLVTAIALGNLLMQIPIGLVADRMAKPRLLAILTVGGVLGAAALPVMPGFWPTLAVLFVWGGMIGGLYTVGLTHLGAKFHGADLAAANGAFVVMYSTGMLVGPPAIGAGLDAFTPYGAPAVMALFFVVYLAVLAVSARRDRA
jgi:MFS family permease